MYAYAASSADGTATDAYPFQRSAGVYFLRHVIVLRMFVETCLDGGGRLFSMWYMSPQQTYLNCYQPDDWTISPFKTLLDRMYSMV